MYLHYVLDLWFDKKIKPKLRGKSHLVRYCDDFVFFFKTAVDADNVETLLKVRLAQFGLAVSEEKTHRTNLSTRKNTNFHERRRMAFLGFTIYRAKNRQGTASKTVFETESKRFRRSMQAIRAKLKTIQHRPLSDQAATINSVLRGHFNYYGIAGNAKRLSRYWHLVRREWKYQLSNRSQNGRLTWECFAKILTEHPLTAPRLRIDYTKLPLYVRL